ncbi:PLDc N-terminal domain-containing protein [Nonomuraea sp. NPDC049607]|uniref:PLDc N-terminal domain-containing protein n=1 Tax=unclassified Nonomuraea TaxID=2593643 RepID=UPI00343D58D5
MSRRRRAMLLALASAELVLTGAAAADLRRRPQREIRGWKGVWWLGIFVQPFGPIAYLTYGRRKGHGS